WLEPAVELRLRKISRRLAQDLVGLAKLTVLSFQCLQLRGHIRRHAWRTATVAIRLLHPFQPRMGEAANLPRDRSNRRTARRMLAFMIQHHPHRTLADLRRKLVRRRTRHGSTFLRVGASGKPGAVHQPLMTKADSTPIRMA